MILEFHRILPWSADLTSPRRAYSGYFRGGGKDYPTEYAPGPIVQSSVIPYRVGKHVNRCQFLPIIPRGVQRIFFRRQNHPSARP